MKIKMKDQRMRVHMVASGTTKAEEKENKNNSPADASTHDGIGEDQLGDDGKQKRKRSAHESELSGRVRAEPKGNNHKKSVHASAHDDIGKEQHGET